MASIPQVDSSPPASRLRPVAVLMSRFPSVTETFILREMIEMERQEQQVLLVPMLREHPPVVHEAARPWTGRALFTPFLDRVIASANLRALLHAPLRYLGLLARLVAGTIGRPSTLIRTLAVFPKSVWLAGELPRRGVTHLHAHYATHPSTMALIVSELSPVTFSFTVHAHDIQLDRSLLRWKLARARFVRSISDYNRRFLERLYPSEGRGKIEVIHVGIETGGYQARRPAPGPPRLLCVAAYKPYKGLPVLIEACRLLREEGVELSCDVVGHGPMQGELEALIRRAGLDGIVRLAGPRPQEEVTRMMGEATAFVLPSIVAADGQMEGIPVALMEAMASGKPVVSTRISGIPELVESGVDGLLVEPGDAAALAASIRSLLADPALRSTLGARARVKVEREFSLPECVSRLLARLDQEAGTR